MSLPCSASNLAFSLTSRPIPFPYSTPSLPRSVAT
jgi:hypothetical protein